MRKSQNIQYIYYTYNTVHRQTTKDKVNEDDPPSQRIENKIKQ